jgi:hypothetical protein
VSGGFVHNFVNGVHNLISKIFKDAFAPLHSVKNKLLKSDMKHKTRIYFDDFVNAVHNRKAATPRQARLTKSTVKTDVDLQARAARH